MSITKETCVTCVNWCPFNAKELIGACKIWHASGHTWPKAYDACEHYKQRCDRYVVMIKRKCAEDAQSWEEYSGIRHREPIDASIECIEAGKDPSVRIARVLVKKGVLENGVEI